MITLLLSSAPPPTAPERRGAAIQNPDDAGSGCPAATATKWAVHAARRTRQRGGTTTAAMPADRATPKRTAITRGRRRVGGNRAPRPHGQGGASAWVIARGEPAASPRGKEHAPQRDGVGGYCARVWADMLHSAGQGGGRRPVRPQGLRPAWLADASATSNAPSDEWQFYCPRIEAMIV